MMFVTLNLILNYGENTELIVTDQTKKLDQELCTCDWHVSIKTKMDTFNKMCQWKCIDMHTLLSYLSHVNFCKSSVVNNNK